MRDAFRVMHVRSKTFIFYFYLPLSGGFRRLSPLRSGRALPALDFVGDSCEERKREEVWNVQLFDAGLRESHI